ncbi:MAG TPA: type II toxin-antitoxin system VapC family toxin [Thermoanaerobaculia bacterium]|nr:type II toxin-antitoxin system VapC family toxin [Thermoanaerobaculia bacterium]
MFLVDTNVVSELIRPRPFLPLVRRLLSTDPAVLFASEITRYELRFGAAIHPRPGEVWSKVEREILPLPIWLPIDEQVSLAAADLQALLRKSGKPIEMPDTILAATASVHDLVLVTRNVRHFQNVPGLAVENWFSEK